MSASQQRWGLLLGLLVSLLCCRPRPNATGAVPTASTASVAPSTKVAEPEDWILSALRKFEAHRGQRTERAELTFARVRFRLPKLSPRFEERHCPTRADCRERTRYVRIAVSNGQLEFLPDCSVLDDERLLDELRSLGPWKGATALESGQQLELVGREGQHLGAVLEFVEHPRGTSLEVWDEWLYARSMASAFAESNGFDVPLLGQEVCSASDNAAQCEVELATLGNPLAIVAPTPPACPSDLTPKECLRRYVLLPVDAGYFQNFCGRTGFGWPGAPLTVAFERERSSELTRSGVQISRLLAGSAWTAFGHRVPQVDVFVLSRAITALGLREELEPRFAAVANAADVSFRNRFRAKILALSLSGSLDDAELLKQFRALVRRCGPGAHASDCSSRPKDAQLDQACVVHTLGLANWACAHR